jgi:hypothetical protein
MPNEPTDVFALIDMKGPDECWAWKGSWGGRATDRRPYFMAAGRRTMSYRWVWELVNGTPVPDGQVLRHTCDNGAWPIGCSNPYHVIPGSAQENSNDMMERERHGLPKTVRNAIRTLLDQGKTQQEVADQWGVSRETISAIATQRVYKMDSKDEKPNK